jgi:diguanylate cyclase (GGDEF)-like protein/PAS domain S-box-containing protein
MAYSSQQNATTDIQSTEIQSYKVLVVDDERLNRAVLCKFLEQDNYETFEAEDGPKALESISRQKFDLVLLDIVMGDMDGFEVLARIRKKYSGAELPVIMVTANHQSEQIVRAFESGANDYVTKPVDRAVMMARISMHLDFKESREALKQSEERYTLVAQGTNDGIWDWNLDTNKVYYSPRWISMLGVDEEDPESPEVWLGRIHVEDRPRVEMELKTHQAGMTPQFEAEMRMRHSDGSYRWTLCRGVAVLDELGIAHRMAGSLTDITEGKVADALTGLPNRVLFRERLERCVQRKNRDKNFNFALLYLDLDNFKHVNDSLGHEAGDRLLVSIARRLESSLREADSFVCRLGGDEFSILIEGIGSGDDAIHVADRIISSVGAPISVGSGKEVFASVSVGICRSCDGFSTGPEMLQAADKAMYRAKKEGKSCYRLFDPVMKEDASKRVDLENELRLAVKRDELFLHYQPIVEVETSKLVGFEALVRWNHERIGFVSPAEFIPIAEETGLVVPIGKLVLREACRQLADWKAQNSGFDGIQVSVNLSSIQLKSMDLIEDVMMTVKESGIEPSDLKIEVTESSIMSNPQLGAEVLSELQKLGVKVAIDDFGTGYSSLAHIHDLAPDAVKIDRSFIDQINTSVDMETIVRAIVALAEGLNLDVVAEGVETESQRILLAEMGVEFAQGFLFAKPLNSEEVLELMIDQVENPETNSAVSTLS